MKSPKLYWLVIMIISLKSNNIYSQQESSIVQPISKLDVIAGVNVFPINIERLGDNFGIFLGFTLNDKFLVNYNYLTYTNPVSSSNRIQILGANYIFSFERSTRFVLGGSLCEFHSFYESQGSQPKTERERFYLPSINVGCDIKLTEKFKTILLINLPLPSLSIGLKYQLSEKEYSRVRRKKSPKNLRKIEIY